MNSKRAFAYLLLSTLGLVLCSSFAAAEIYKYEDQKGNLYFTDRPMKGSSYRLLWRSGSDRAYGGSRIDTGALERNRKRYSSLINRVAHQTELPPALLHAIVRVESAYDPNALSRAGARGLMQLMPATAKRFGVRDSWNPEQNLRGGARYLNELLRLFSDDLNLALAAYNAGENAVIRYGNRIPPFQETEEYVTKVLGYYGERNLSGNL